MNEFIMVVSTWLSHFMQKITDGTKYKYIDKNQKLSKKTANLYAVFLQIN